MQLRTLGRSNLRIAPLCLGGNVFGWTAAEAASFAVLDASVSAGNRRRDMTQDGCVDLALAARSPAIERGLWVRRDCLFFFEGTTPFSPSRRCSPGQATETCKLVRSIPQTIDWASIECPSGRSSKRQFARFRNPWISPSFRTIIHGKLH
jgi:hypothetical protein